MKEHVTSPPPRYNDGSLVQKMEELGIGRPSTYAATIELLQKRGYVHPRRGGRGPLVPTAVGRLTVEYLKECFPEYVEYEVRDRSPRLAWTVVAWLNNSPADVWGKRDKSWPSSLD